MAATTSVEKSMFMIELGEMWLREFKDVCLLVAGVVSERAFAK
jgi:hypothetical protein